MVIITNISYPPESAKEIASRFLEAPQIPNYMQRKGPYINSSLTDGITTISVYELDKTYLAEGLELKMVPVRTSGPIPKEKLFEAMKEIKKVKIYEPVVVGRAVIKNFLGLGVDLVATRENLKEDLNAG